MKSLILGLVLAAAPVTPPAIEKTDKIPMFEVTPYGIVYYDIDVDVDSGLVACFQTEDEKIVCLNKTRKKVMTPEGELYGVVMEKVVIPTGTSKQQTSINR